MGPRERVLRLKAAAMRLASAAASVPSDIQAAKAELYRLLDELEPLLAATEPATDEELEQEAAIAATGGPENQPFLLPHVIPDLRARMGNQGDPMRWFLRGYLAGARREGRR